MDAGGWIFLRALVVVLAGYAYRKGALNPC
jgi:hypothetical protein